jgi:hypothetical protein
MLICLDYDGTYTADPIFWDQFIDNAKASGHRVICTTMRYEDEGDEVKEYLESRVEAIYFTSRSAKKPWLLQRGIKPDIWIDDMPEWLVQDAK